jgi:hypothetical protein
MGVKQQNLIRVSIPITFEVRKHIVEPVISEELELGAKSSYYPSVDAAKG